MYYILKSNTFFTEIESGGIFFRNNNGNLIIKTEHSYKIFMSIYPYLDGMTDLDKLLISLEERILYNFLENLLKSLLEHNFLMKFNSPTNMDKKNKLAQFVSYYSNTFDETAEMLISQHKIQIVSDEKKFSKVSKELFLKNGFENVFVPTIEKIGNSDTT
ncbi:hypothetical protein CW380_07400, partial [Listeria monocytogenes]|nr:hypothetical protein [Listeria monocytogenes]